MGIIKRLKWKDKSGKTTDYDLGAKASNVEEDATHRFVSDTEKQTWNDKANPEDIPSGSAASYGVANNDTTNRSDMLVTSQVAYQHGREIDQLNSEFQSWFGVTEDGQRGWKEQGADTVHPFSDTVNPLIPILTGPNNNIITDTINSNYPAWLVYDGNVTTGSVGATYWGYKFDVAVCVKIVIWIGYNENSPGIGPGASVQASNDGAKWDNIYQFDGDRSYNIAKYVICDNFKYYKYWRVSGTTGAGLKYLQFCGY